MNTSTQVNNVPSKWMTCPESNTKYPGLAYIEPLAELIIVNQADKLHKVIGKTTGFTIYNNRDEKVLLAVQEKKTKNFETKIFNFYGNEVIRVQRKSYKLCRKKVKVWAPPGNFVGTVKEVKGMTCVNTYLVEDEYGKTVLRIIAKKPENNIYNIMDKDEKIGVISNDWYCGARVNHFGLKFPVNLDICYKTVLIGACFLIAYIKCGISHYKS